MLKLICVLALLYEVPFSVAIPNYNTAVINVLQDQKGFDEFDVEKFCEQLLNQMSRRHSTPASEYKCSKLELPKSLYIFIDVQTRYTENQISAYTNAILDNLIDRNTCPEPDEHRQIQLLINDVIIDYDVNKDRAKARKIFEELVCDELKSITDENADCDFYNSLCELKETPDSIRIQYILPNPLPLKEKIHRTLLDFHSTLPQGYIFDDVFLPYGVRYVIQVGLKENTRTVSDECERFISNLREVWEESGELEIQCKTTMPATTNSFNASLDIHFSIEELICKNIFTQMHPSKLESFLKNIVDKNDVYCDLHLHEAGVSNALNWNEKYPRTSEELNCDTGSSESIEEDL